MSPFMRYSRKVFDVIRASNRALSYSEIAKSTGQLWSELTDEEKKPYVDEYEEEKIKYDNERMRMGYRESVDPSVQRATKTVWSREHARHAVVAGSFPHHERRYENRSTAVAAASRTDQRADGDQWTSNVNGRASPSKQPASVFDQAASSSAEVLTIDQLESSVDEQVSCIDNSSSASEETLSASERLTSCTDEQIVTIDRRALSAGDKQNSVEELSSAEDERVSTVRQVESTIDEEMLTIDHDASTSDGRMLDDNVPDELSCISEKPLTPYLKFSTEVLDSVKEQYPHYKMVLVLDRIRTMWEELTPVQKLVYYEESGVEAEKNKLDSTNVLGAPAGALKEYTEVEEIELVSHALTASEGQLVELHSPANGQAQVSTVSTPLATILAHASVPPQPWIMGVSAMQKGLIISWNLRVEDSHLPIAGYQLYASKQGSLVPPSVEAWRLVSRVDALPLPMACAVSHGRTNSRYYFAVRALDTSGRCGPFSRPYCVEYSLK